MLKHAEGYRVRVLRRIYGEHEQITARPPSPGAVSGPILDRKIGRWPWLSGSRRLPIAVASDDDLETLILILSHHPVLSH
jgi:hypothetical protein